MSTPVYNLDLNVIETVLKTAGFNVKPAMSMPALLRSAVQRNTTFVLPLDEEAHDFDEIGGIDVSQYSMEQFAVVGVFRASGNSSGSVAGNELLTWRNQVKTTLIGLMVEPFAPITFQAGRLIEVNKETQNVVYQLQFKTTCTVVTNVRTYP
ncbi:hypothetical protein SAMN05216361_0043 [Marisediminitalea aggregata]|uniref:Uncharacterized protein n=1 Tax=Marisediminitalea aggregata TaxID=634436 RepID=A0A1M5SNI3_9ALTE|nr:hypothetical protein [Marisediminitalea aggregata]SHH40010.1 hypothetical protein SAMN05216361_0043 [Marisediminitalea aggregata]